MTLVLRYEPKTFEVSEEWTERWEALQGFQDLTSGSEFEWTLNSCKEVRAWVRRNVTAPPLSSLVCIVDRMIPVDDDYLLDVVIDDRIE